MKDIVEEALQHAKETQGEASETSPDAHEFGPSVCAIVGCGAVGISRIEQVDDADVSIAVATPSTLDEVPSNLETDNSVVEVEMTDERVLNYSNLESALNNAVFEADVIVVTGHLENTASVRLIEAVCRKLPEQSTVLAVPSIPEDGLSTGEKSVFFELIHSAGTTVPYDLTRVSDTYRASKTDNKDTLEIANSLIAEWTEDVFKSVCVPPRSGLCTQPSLASELFDNGGVSLLYWGWGSREEDPEAVIKHAASNRVCDGNRETATAGFGFVRFGHEFTLKEFEALEEAASQWLRSDNVDDRRWVFSGDNTLTFSVEYRLAHLVVDIDPKSLAFL